MVQILNTFRARNSEWVAQAAPSTPSAGIGGLWFDTVSKHFKQIDDAGVTTDLASSGGNAVTGVVDFGFRGQTGIVSDSFNRSVSNGLGSADVGGVYTVRGTATNLQVAPTQATIFCPDTFSEQGGNLGSTSGTDMDVTATFQTTDAPADADFFFHISLRHQGIATDNNNAYFIEVDIQPGSSQTLIQLLKNVAGVDSALTTTAVAVAPGLWAANQLLKIRVQVVGNVFRAKVWRAADAEPGTWTRTATDGSFAAGWCGWGGQCATSASTAGGHYALSSFVVTSLSSAAAPYEDNFATLTVAATWVTASSAIACSIMGGTTDHPDAEEPVVEEITVQAGNIVAGVGFDIMAYAPEGTWGQYNVRAVGV